MGGRRKEKILTDFRKNILRSFTKQGSRLSGFLWPDHDGWLLHHSGRLLVQPGSRLSFKLWLSKRGCCPDTCLKGPQKQTRWKPPLGAGLVWAGDKILTLSSPSTTRFSQYCSPADTFFFPSSWPSRSGLSYGFNNITVFQVSYKVPRMH